MPTAAPQILTVTELTRRIKTMLEDALPAVWVEGEISNFAAASSGHCYFTLKDAGAALSVVMFRNVASRLAFKPADGLQVLAFGPISVYEKRGQYQLIAAQLMPKGLGALQLAFEQLKQKLAKEGLFDADRKKPLPLLPQRIGLVTSPTGAALRDFLNIITRRFPNLHIIINPVRVQGDGAAEEIAAAIDEFNDLRLADVIVVTRGGGSLEDLWAFNEEVVARAIARSRIPTISAVGHEIDFTIADFVADLRAPTPSAAAELVVRAKQEYLALLAQQQRRLDKDLRLRLAEARRRFNELAASYVFRQPAELIRQYQQQTDDLAHRLQQATRVALERRRARLAAIKLITPQARLAQNRQRLAACEQQLATAWTQYRQQTRHRVAQAGTRLQLLSPQSTLERGYSITRLPDGKIVRSINDVTVGAELDTVVANGNIASKVTAKKSDAESDGNIATSRR
jgi:exodeoxyribonuclease VII large subunit